MVNYAEGIFTREYTEGRMKLYATFHPEVVLESTEYTVTKRWLVVLLHPEYGLHPFFILHNDLMKRWETDQNDTHNIEDEILQWCGRQIERGKKVNSL